MRFIASGSILTQRHSWDLPIAQYKGLLVYVSGTNNTSQTLALSDMNNIRVNRNGKDIVNVDFDRAQQLSDLLDGLTVNSSSSGSSFEFAFKIPFYVGKSGEFPNVLDISKDDTAMFHLDFGNLSTPVSAGTYEIYGIESSGVEVYEPMIISDQISLSASGTERRPAPAGNIHSVYTFPSTAANYSKLTIEKDNRIVEDANYSALQAYTNIVTQKESSAIEVTQTVLAQSDRLDELFSENVYITPLANSSGSLTVDVVLIGTGFNTKKRSESNAVRDQRIAENVNVKRLKNRSAELDALQTV